MRHQSQTTNQKQETKNQCVNHGDHGDIFHRKDGESPLTFFQSHSCRPSCHLRSFCHSRGACPRRATLPPKLRDPPAPFSAAGCGQMRTLMRTLIWLTRAPPPEGREAESPDFTGCLGCRSRRMRTLRPLDRLFCMFRFIFMISLLFVAFRNMRPHRTA